MKHITNYMYFIVVLVVILACLCSYGCGHDNQSSQTNEKTTDGILVKLSTDKDTYKLGEQVNINVYVENQSSDPFQYEYAQIKIHLTVYSEGGDYIGISADGKKYTAELAIATMGTLGAGESIALDTFWDQKFIDDNAEEHNAAPGNYTIKANFAGLEYIRRMEGLPSDTDSVAINIVLGFNHNSSDNADLLAGIENILTEGWTYTIINESGEMGHAHGLEEPTLRIDFFYANDESINPYLRLNLYNISEKEEILSIIEQQQYMSWDIPTYFTETRDYIIITSPLWNQGDQSEEFQALETALKDYFI